MNYDSSICSSCNCYTGFGRCVDKYGKCKDVYDNCLRYRNIWNSKHNPLTDEKIKQKFMNNEIDYRQACDKLISIDKELTNSDAQGIVDLWELEQVRANQAKNKPKYYGYYLNGVLISKPFNSIKEASEAAQLIYEIDDERISIQELTEDEIPDEYLDSIENKKDSISLLSYMCKRG